MLSGCASDQAVNEKLNDAYKQLESPRPDYAMMMEAADGYLTAQPNGKGTAEALYLRGRAFEEKSRQDSPSPEQDLTQANIAYTQAMGRSPKPGLEGLIHTGIGNVLYFQNRFAPAINELTAGFEKLERDNDKAWALYRIGLCQQRMGQWEFADRTFSSVQQQFAGTDQSTRAAQHLGARAFWVQVGAFAGAAQADATVTELKKLGLTGSKFADPSRPGVQLVRVGPIANYDAALAVKQRVWAKYQGAMIVP